MKTVKQDEILDLLVKVSAFGMVSEVSIDAATERLLYYQELERKANEAFNVLAEDNTYTEASNMAWKLLGEGLHKVESSQPPGRLRGV